VTSGRSGFRQGRRGVPAPASARFIAERGKSYFGRRFVDFAVSGFPSILSKSANGTMAKRGRPRKVTSTRLPAMASRATRVKFHRRASLVMVFTTQT